MIFNRLFMIATVLSFFITKGSMSASTGEYLKYLNNSIEFFNRNAFDEESGCYFSEVDNVGNVVSRKVHTVALSRMIYGLAYSSTYFPENLKRAQLAAQFQLNNLIGVDSVGKYFIPTIENGVVQIDDALDIWQQAYGLCGLTELYRVTKDDSLLKTIHELHRAFLIRFRDSENGGFYGEYSLSKGQVKGTKTLQSLIYPITAYMANLWSADTAHQFKYDYILKEHLEIAYQKVWNSQCGWVNRSFNDYWTPIQNRATCVVTPGHNFQYASLLLRAHKWNFIAPSEGAMYSKLGRTILNTTLLKPIWHNNSIKNGFYSEVNSSNDFIVSDLRCWWQHCEAIIALSLAKDQFGDELNELIDFYFTNFSDMEKGGDFFYVDRFDKPVTSELKGSKGKSTYHVAEMIRFLIDK